MTDLLDLGTVAVLGFGNQGEAHAHNLRDSGVRIRVGARPGGTGAARAHTAGFEVRGLPEAAAGADLAVVLLPDEVVPGLWPSLGSVIPAPQAWLFAHGFNLLYSNLAFGDAQDVLLVSPTAPGRVLRLTRARGEHIPAYVGVHLNGSGSGWQKAERYAELLGCGPTWRTSIREETEVDLFGEQTVLCGGMNALVTAAFETLVGAGYSPEIAYLECVHQLRYLAELLHERGVTGMREGISGTALFGDLTRGPRVIGPETRRELGRILEEIRSGDFAREWSEEAATGRPRIQAGLDAGSRHPIEAARLRALAGPDSPLSDPGRGEPRGA